MTDEWERLIKTYLVGQRQAGKTKGTYGLNSPKPLTEQTHKELGKYGAALRGLAQWMTGRGLTSPTAATADHLREWGAESQDAAGKIGARSQYFAAKGLFAWLTEEKIITDDPMATLKAPKNARPTLQRTLSPEEVQAILQACDGRKLKNIRDRAVLCLLLDTGLRASEICQLKLDELHFDTDSAREPQHSLKTTIKGEQLGVGHFSDLTAQTLLQWLAVRPLIAAEGVTEVFVAVGGTRPGHPMTRGGGLRNICQELSKQANIAEFSPHALRRSFAILLTEAGAPSRVIQELGRWTSLQMVERYTSAYQAARQFNQYSPIKLIYRMGH